jgi:23S rRNA (adenine2030-N6)-methyltransferase
MYKGAIELYHGTVLSYRHAFHAGNAADVLKHATLIFCLDYLRQKEKSCLYVDTHAGAGLYSLNAGYAAQNREWESGIGALWNQNAFSKELLGQDSGLLKRYLDIIDTEARGSRYPGSAVIMKKLLRAQDRLVCFELHPADFASLQNVLKDTPHTTILRDDGLKGLKALLPPPCRRACMLIDPSYEMKTDYDILPLVLAEALHRFPSGLYIIWYPLLRHHVQDSPLALFPEKLLGLYAGNRCCIELCTAIQKSPSGISPRGMYGSGLVIYNPPWTLKKALEESLPALAFFLGGVYGSWNLRWESNATVGG